MSEENTTSAPVANQKLASVLVTILNEMQKQGTVKLHVSAYDATYTVTGADKTKVRVDKANPNGFTWFQMYLITSPTAEIHICADEAGFLETTVISTDYNRRVKYTFSVVEAL